MHTRVPWRVARKDFPELVFEMGGFIYLKDSVKLQSFPKNKKRERETAKVKALGSEAVWYVWAQMIFFFFNWSIVV